MLEIVLSAMLGGLIAIVAVLTILKFLPKEKPAEQPVTPIQPVPVIHVEAPVDPRIDDLIDVVSEMPQKVLESITSSANRQKGQLGELIGYLNLNSKYDKLLALRDITDFLAIRFSKNGVEGSVDFIDVKNGPNARLTKDQLQLRDLIKNGKVNFYSFKVETNSNSDSTSES